MTPRGMIYPGESISPWYHTLASQLFFNLKFNNSAKSAKNILFNWSVAQAQSNNEKNEGEKSRWNARKQDSNAYSASQM